ncbi:unnamed protein product, partial [marine sediment metagenome]
MLPNTVNEIGKWCENASILLSNIFSKSNDIPLLKNMIQRTGILLFERRFLDPKDYELRFDDSTKSIIAKLEIPKSNDTLYSIMTSGKLKFALVHLIKQTECSKCGKSYRYCGCIKYLDNKVVQKIT